MRLSIRSTLALSLLVVILAACGTAAGDSPVPSSPAPSSAAEPSDEPSQAPSEAPSEEPSDAPDADGTLTMVDGMAVGGPGGSIEDALASGMTDPMLVNGVLFMAEDGTIYLASEVSDADAPTFGGPTLEVIGYPENAAEWDPANADETNLKVVNGTLFFERAQLFGVVES